MKTLFQTIVLALFCTSTCFADDWVMPWVSNRDGEWKSVMTLNNHGASSATVSLTAVRSDGASAQVTGLAIPAHSQWVLNPADAFASLGSGSGYSVFIHAETAELTFAVKVSALSTASGDSPSLADAVHFSQSFTYIVLPALPNDGGIAAAVLLNLSTSTSTVTVQPRGALQTYAPREVTLPPGQPKAFLIFGEGGLVSEAHESLALEVSGAVALTGAVFSFNALNEPSLMNALASPVFDTDALTSVLGTLDTTAVVADSYIEATSFSRNTHKTDCPTVTGSIDFGETTSNVEVDWGTGCTNALGVYHEGKFSFQMDRQGRSWIQGGATLEDFGIRYQANIFKIDGFINIAGSTQDNNFTLNGAWDASANTPGFYGAYQGQAALTLSGQSSGFSAYGSLSTQVTGAYSYSLEGSISAADPIVYNLNACIWPTAGTVILKSTTPWPQTISLDFGTGTCNTAILTVNGTAKTINLDDFL